jgi:hypothetical protein
MAVLFIGQEICRQRRPTPGEHGHKTLLSERTDEAIESHRGDMADDRAPLQTEAPMHGQHSVAGYIRMHLAIAQDEVGEDHKHCSTPGALETPDRDAAQTGPHIMQMTRQASSPITGRLVLELEAEGQEEGEHIFNKRLAVSNQAEVCGFVSKIDGDRAVFAPRFGRCAHVSPLMSSGLVSW